MSPAELAALKRELDRTDTVMLKALKAGFERVGSIDCMESARLCQSVIARRTDASCAAWARNARIPLAVRS